MRLKKLWLKTSCVAATLALLMGTVVFAVSASAEDEENTGAAAAEEVGSAPAAPAAESGGGAPAGEAGGIKFSFGGYIREHISLNLQDVPETKQNDRWDLSMARSTLQVEGDVIKDDIRLHAIGRVVGEMKTDYLKRLENLGAAGGDLMRKYNVSDIRELYLEFSPLPRTQVRLGKQQIVWGETDFFQAMDIVQGFDFTWRTFLEGENEDYRKPLVMGSAIVQVPELHGALHLFLRPGLDRTRDIGNTYDTFGGRWANQPNKGFDFTPLVPYNFHHPDGNVDNPTWGIRWAGSAGPVNFSTTYLRTFGPNPVVNSAFNPHDTAGTLGPLGEFIYPRVDMFGLTASTASDFVDAVFSTELTYTKGQFYNVGTNFLGGALPGFGGIIKKDTVRAMLRMDKQLKTMSLLGTSQASFFSIQVFDTWIPNFDQKDDIVDTAGYGGAKKEHSGIATAVFGLNYMNSRLNPQIAGGIDLSYGGGFFIPSVELAFGDKWRLKAEADLFFAKASKQAGQIENSTHLMGYFQSNDQLSIRLSRYF